MAQKFNPAPHDKHAADPAAALEADRDTHKQLEAGIARMAGGGGPDIGVAHGVDQGAEAARGFSEDAAPSGAAAAEPGFDGRQHLADEKVLVVSEDGRIDILVAAETREAIGEGDDDGRHLAFADQAVEPLGDVFGKGLPGGVGRAAGGIANEIDQERQVPAVVAGRHIDIDNAAGGIA